MSAKTEDLVTLRIDGDEVCVPKGTLIIRAAEKLGIHIPRFCDHPLLKPAGACRQCLVDVAAPDREGNVRPFPKPQASCTMTVMEGMEVSTQLTSESVARAQRGVMEMLLLNHPLDCPVCDKGGECPLQNQAMTAGRSATRFTGVKRTFAKPVKISTSVLLDRERCILCQRCIRFSREIAGDPFITLQCRGGGSSPLEDHPHMGAQIGTFDTQVLGFYDEETNPNCHTLTGADGLAGPAGAAGVDGSLQPGPTGPAEVDSTGRVFASYFSGNTIQICPVGALTSASYRFRSRPFDLVSTPSVTEHDASGAALRVDVRRGEVLRRMAGEDSEVNEEWLSDKDRFAFPWAHLDDRLATPLVRDENGELVTTSWMEAFEVAIEGLQKARRSGKVGLLPGGRLPFEDAYAWSKFARIALNTNNIDHRVRVHSKEEDDFLAAHVAGTGLGVTYTDIENAKQILMVGFEPEDECATLFLRLRKASLKGTKVATIAPFTSPGSHKLSAQVLTAAPGTEPEIIAALSTGEQDPMGQISEGLRQGGIILVGERAGATPGLLTALTQLQDKLGARLAWIPRRAGERGGIDAGTLPNLLVSGRPVVDSSARVDVASVWGQEVPQSIGLDANEILAAGAAGELDALLIGGVDLRDFANSTQARAALENTGFVVSLEVRASEVSDLADVVFPVAPPVEKPGTFVNWEGRLRPFGQALATRAMSDREVLNKIATGMEHPLGLDKLRDVHTEANELMVWDGPRASMAPVRPGPLANPQAGTAVLATYKPLLDEGLCQDGEPHLAGTARKSVARISAATAAASGLESGVEVRISTEKGQIVLPWIASDIPDRVVWVPQCSTNSHVHEDLGVTHGAIVTIASEVTR